ncbi:unnamed protein product [Caenorhabditis auriculariae]|uniref:SCP domain-containing protein n=1 Tax=Caenorhabditis auriculariae TaxID=2777116 RepID=A0A8S1H1Q4_9PELO|nr:unnamed protein product [Caenorhabditis auriculariae]
MYKMKWDETLEKSAQAFADTCPTGHSETKGVGENMYWAHITEKPEDLNSYGINATTAWQDEFQKFGWPSDETTVDLFSTGIGHATAMAWAATENVGCGVKLCPAASATQFNTVVVVCQYFEPGNMVGNQIYEEGPTCSKCPAKIACEALTGLCA